MGGRGNEKNKINYRSIGVVLGYCGAVKSTPMIMKCGSNAG